jgi:hypothetical protein
MNIQNYICILIVILLIVVIFNYFSNGLITKNYYKFKNNNNNNMTEYETIDGASVSEVTYKMINNKPTINIIRDNGELVSGDNTTFFEPKYILKDNMGENDINSTEYTSAQIPNNIPDTAWTDYRISQTPSFYSNNINDEKTNLKLFFDDQNQFHNTIEESYFYNNIKRMPIPACYIGKNNVNVCNFNNKLQRIPLNLSNLSYDDLYYTQSKDDIIDNNLFINNEIYSGSVMPASDIFSR